VKSKVGGILPPLGLEANSPPEDIFAEKKARGGEIPEIWALFLPFSLATERDRCYSLN
jgi:hypothetical protein